ncbi:MAG: sulfatase family protein [Acidobacteriaceae bacterium]
MLTRRQVIGGGMGVMASSLVRSRVAYARDRKPNLLYILADDHAGYVLGADGNQRAHTPNIDRFASQGTRFAKNYCNAPVCTPSRQSFFTSQLPHSAGVTVLSTPLAQDKPTLAMQLAASGYDPAVYGKMHFNVPGRPGLHGFNIACTEDVVRKDWTQQVGPWPVYPNIPTKPKQWRPFRDPARIWLDADKLPFDRDYENMEGTWIPRQGVKYIQEHKDDPFALWVSFRSPHSPFDFPIEDRATYDPSSFPVPEVGPEDFHQIPLIFRDLTPQQKQGIIASYYTAVSFLDRNVGEVLQALKDANLDNDTLVIYMADHGYSLGQHGRFEKHVCYEPALRVPLIFRWPGHITSGSVIHQFTESIDVPPTIVEMLGIEPFAVNHGRSMRSYLQTGKDAQPRQSIFSEYLENEEACVKTDRWKLIHCSGRRLRRDGYLTDNPLPGRYIELYDQHLDPGEFTNVAAAHPEVVQQLSAQMLQIFRTTHPDAPNEPSGLSSDDLLDWYLRPRDAKPSPDLPVVPHLAS